jgi:murein DD-endopeptidase MepM/ murein hydrolase activator NlpD
MRDSSLLMRRLAAAITVVALTAGGLSLAPTLGYHDDRLREIEHEKAELREKIHSADVKAAGLQQRIAASDRRLSDLERRIVSFNYQIFQAEGRLSAAEADLAIARAELISIERTLARTLERLDYIQDTANRRAREIYKGGLTLQLEALLTADSLRDFLARIVFVRSVLSEDGRMVVELEEMTERLDKARFKAVKRKEDIDRHLQEIKDERKRIELLRDDLASGRQAVLAEISTRRQLLAQVERNKAAYLEAMRQLEAESQSIASLLRSRQSGQVYVAGQGEELAWPVTGSITSGYGWRTSPIYGDRRFHTGIDIGAQTGQPVIASASGEVVLSGYLRGYGLTVIIDHGNAMATLYGHNSTVAVSEGAQVSRGQVISGVGCTGYCTGPHLHFEVRINGDHVNPMQFF